MLRRGKEFFFFRSGDFEVDFVVPSEQLAIQACYNISDEETRIREFSALYALGKQMDMKNYVVVSKDNEGTAEYRGIEIQITPVWKWLLP